MIKASLVFFAFLALASGRRHHYDYYDCEPERGPRGREGREGPRGAQGAPGPNGTGFFWPGTCEQSDCPDGWISVNRKINNDVEKKWCINMFWNQATNDLYKTSEKVCNSYGGVMTGFKDKGEFISVFALLKNRFPNIKPVSQVMIGARRLETCASISNFGNCTITKGTKWTDLVMSSDSFFNELQQSARFSPLKKCIVANPTNLKLYVANCNVLESDYPQDLFMCGRFAPCKK